ncbi:hypothetical protein ATN38_24315 [Rhodococcus sp. FH8]|nr:hypothetical protein [Rhodococcus sp. FH8]
MIRDSTKNPFLMIFECTVYREFDHFEACNQFTEFSNKSFEFVELRLAHYRNTINSHSTIVENEASPFH